jgi:hypothetical protein
MLTFSTAEGATIAINAAGGVYNTGVDASGATLPDGTIDLHYTITASPDGPSTETAKTSASGFPIPPWLGDDASSDWIGETAGYPSLNEGVGNFDNVTTFTSPIAGIVTITGQWATDDAGVDILLDGVSTGNTAAGFSSFSAFSITGAVTAGTNTLDFINGNTGGPGGVRVEFASAIVVPEPASIVLLGFAAIGLVCVARRRGA